MAIVALDHLRLAIADRVRLILGEVIGIGDGVALAYRAMFVPLITASEVLYVDAVLKTRVDDYAVDDDLGLITLKVAPINGTKVWLGQYQWTTFSDTELLFLLEEKGQDVTLAAIEAIKWLLVDTDRWLKYFYGQEMVDRTQCLKALQDLLSRLEQAKVPVGWVKADSAAMEERLFPFIEQEQFEDFVL